jgi:integrase
MASIAKRPDGRWRARYRDASGREHSKHFVRKFDGQRWLDEVTAAVVTGQYVDPRAGKVTFRAYAEQWRSAQVHRPNTAAAVESALRVHAYPAFGESWLGTIRASEIQAFVRGLSDRLAPASTATVYQHVRAVFRAAEHDRLIASSPCSRIVLPKKQRRLVEPPTAEQVLAITGLMPEHLRAMVTFMAGTGVRPGEAAGLKADRLDMLRRTARIDQQLLLTRPPSFGPPKTEASTRNVPLPQVVCDALAAHLVQFPAIDGLVFHEPDGRPVHRDLAGRHFHRAAERVGAADGTRLHDLRHFYASLLIHHGASVKVVQARLGHASAKETLDVYGHMWPDSEDMTRAAVDEVLGSAADCLRTKHVAG